MRAALLNAFFLAFSAEADEVSGVGADGSSSTGAVPLSRNVALR